MELAGTALKVFGKIKAGNEAKRSADREAAQLRDEAAARRVEGQLSAQEEKRQARLVESRALAVSAASGGGVSNTTITNVLGDIHAEGDYRALMRRYSADTEAKGLEKSAANVQAGGRAARTGSRIGAATTLFTEGGDLWDKYKPKKATS